MSPPVDRLVNDDRFSGDNVALFLAYLPLGLLLVCLRLVVGVLLWFASLLLPNKAGARRLLSTVACLTFGMHVKQKGTRDPKSSMIVANYVSAMDPLAAYYALGTISLRKWKLPPFFASALGIKNTSHFVGKRHFSDSGCRPVLLQPEGMATNGSGLLQFQDYPVPLLSRVQPLAIKVERMFTKVTVHSALDSADKFPWSDVLWFLWTPATSYSLQALPAVERAAGEADADFAERIRRQIAAALEVEATEYAAAELTECARRGVRHAPPAPAAAAPAAAAPRAPRAELQRLARQVKEVLPRVPTSDILRELARTRSVDVTITNFLEEITPYTPEAGDAPSTSAPAPTPAHTPSTSTPAHTPAAAFPADPRRRQLGFQERKAEMIAAARRRYIEKHGLEAAC